MEEEEEVNEGAGEGEDSGSGEQHGEGSRASAVDALLLGSQDEGEGEGDNDDDDGGVSPKKDSLGHPGGSVSKHHSTPRTATHAETGIEGENKQGGNGQRRRFI